MYHKKSHLTKDFSIENSMLILGITIITLGLYTIYWFYLKNKELEHLDKQAPDSNRGFILMSILPLSWFFIINVIKKLIPKNIVLIIFENIIWLIILLLILKYIYDFCISFGQITKTKGIAWFIPFIITIFSLYLYFLLRINYFLLFILMLFIIIPFMQQELNKLYLHFSFKKDKHKFYH